jgi:ferredoxin
MKLSKTAKTVLICVAVISVIAVAYASLESAVSSEAACISVGTHAALPPDTGSCEGCPYAGTADCPAATSSTAKPYVDEDKCISCGKCVRVAPEAFEMDKQTKKAEIKPGAPAASIAKGANACPVGAVQQ